MSSRHDHRRRDRSWERDDKDRDRERDRDRYSRRRSSRSRSPSRRGGTDSKRPDRRDYGRDRDEDRRDRDPRGSRRDDRDRRDPSRRDGEKRERDRHDRDKDGERARDGEREPPREGERNTRTDSEPRETGKPIQLQGQSSAPASHKVTPAQSDEEGEAEEGEAMDILNGEDEAMSAMMGMSGFGSTKGQHVQGNQDGGAHVKKSRTWRQYMNRRGGFNRPLDKIK